MTVGDGHERGLEIGKWLDVVDLAGLYQRGDAALGDAAFVVAREEGILAIEGDRADEIFDPVGVDLDPAVGQEGLQPAPMVMDVGQLFAQAGFGGDFAALRLNPFAEGRDQGRRAGLTGRKALAGRDATDIGLDGIEVGDTAQPFSCNLRPVTVEDLFQFAPCVRPAMGHPNGGTALARGFGETVVAGVAVDLQNAVEAGQEGFCILARTAGS